MHGIGSIETALADRLAALLREGGAANQQQLLSTLHKLLTQESPEPNTIPIEPLPDPLPWDWRDDPGPTVGVVLYRALLQADDTALAESLAEALRRRGLRPRLIWVSSLRDSSVQAGVRDLLQSQNTEVVITATAFASVRSDSAGLGSPLWEELNCPVLQLLSSTGTRERWSGSSRGLDPLDLSLQVVMPELDGRITTRPCAFRQQRQ